MARSKLSALARSLTLVASVGAPCLAQAADLLPPPPPPPAPPPIEVGGGWYLRGDVGVSIYDEPVYSTYGYDKHPGYKSNEVSFQNAVGSGGFAGVGVGYQFNSFLRGDVTGEYRFSTGLRGSSYYQGGVDEFGYGSYGYNKSTGSFDSAVVLANAYFDLGTWYGITPFVGGGVGVAFNHTSGFSTSENFTGPNYGYEQCKCDGSWSRHLQYDGNGNVVYQTQSGGTWYKDKSTASFAWALHAGLAYNVTDLFKVELAYRYLNLGTVKTGYGSVPCCSSPQPGIKVKDVEAHDVKIGLRYLLGGGIAAPLPPLMADYQPAPGPLVSKY
ncbi:outer membrane protein [Methylobacterium sp. A54F]